MSALAFLYCSVYSGHQSILIPPMELENNLFLWLATVNQYKIRDTFCSYSVMELCTKGLGNQVEVLKVRSSCNKQQSWKVVKKRDCMMLSGVDRHTCLVFSRQSNRYFVNLRKFISSTFCTLSEFNVGLNLWRRR